MLLVQTRMSSMRWSSGTLTFWFFLLTVSPVCSLSRWAFFHFSTRTLRTRTEEMKMWLTSFRVRLIRSRRWCLRRMWRGDGSFRISSTAITCHLSTSSRMKFLRNHRIMTDNPTTLYRVRPATPDVSCYHSLYRWNEVYCCLLSFREQWFYDNQRIIIFR